jgi:Carbohydrate esterase, sialic acid-specific acetylesterase
VCLAPASLVRFRFPLAALCFGLLAFAANSAATSHGTVAPPQEVFVLAGQSNMLGRGEPRSAGEKSNSQLLVWRKKAWKVAADPLGDPNDPQNGVGPGMTFGLDILPDLGSQTIGLVMCAVGRTRITKWQPTSSVYQSCITQVRAAGGHIDGILFLQGESDATSKDNAKAWASRFATTLGAFRSDLGSGIPVVIGQIGKINASDYPYQKTVRNQQTQAGTSNPGVAMITTLDLPTGGDHVHFTVASYKTIGARFATAWWQLRQSFP